MTLTAVATDPAAFAEQLLGQPLWPHQEEVAHSKARYRTINAGRQVGKSRALAVITLHEASTRANILVLLVSAGETASRRLLEECVALATSSPLLRGSVLDESKSQLTLSNGSRIISVPASEKQIRGWPVDLLIVDEAGFISSEIWRAAEPAIIARPGSRVILCSSPWGAADHFFRVLWNRGMDSPDGMYQSWHWPSSVSPLVDDVLLDEIRKRETDEYFRREYLAEWTEEAGAYFTEDEIASAVVDYDLLSLEKVLESGPWLTGPGYVRRHFPAVGGVDWGYARDANALVLVAPVDDRGLNGSVGGRLFVPFVEARSQWSWADFIDRVVEVCGVFDVQVLASETNGVGAYPTDDLVMKCRQAVRGGQYGSVAIQKVWTDARRKQSGFGQLKGLLQRHQLLLPNHPELLKQLRCLEFEQLSGGSTRIAVPDRAGHDDLAMALMQAVSCVDLCGLNLAVRETVSGSAVSDVVSTVDGFQVPRRALPLVGGGPFARWPSGGERGDVW